MIARNSTSVCVSGLEWIKMVQDSSTASSQEKANLWAVLLQLFQHPMDAFIMRWNWKAGALSIILRAPIYVVTTLKYGAQAATRAGLAEALFSAGAAGVYAALTQAIRYAEPQAAVAVLLLAILPAITLAFDALFHHAIGTPNLPAGVLVSLVVSILSSAFNWYSMRRCTLLVGARSRTFSADIAVLPILIGGFLLTPFVVLVRTLKTLCTAGVGEWLCRSKPSTSLITGTSASPFQEIQPRSCKRLRMVIL